MKPTTSDGEAFSLLQVFSAFARFLEEHQYSTTMWEKGYTTGQANEVCAALTEWGQRQLGLIGEFLILWSKQEGTRFSGDSELIYVQESQAYLLPNPFIEGDPDGFLTSLLRLLDGAADELYPASIRSRILFNAV